MKAVPKVGDVHWFTEKICTTAIFQSRSIKHKMDRWKVQTAVMSAELHTPPYDKASDAGI